MLRPATGRGEAAGKFVGRDQTKADLKKLAGLYYTPDDFVRAVQTNAPALAKVIGAAGVNELIAWAKTQRTWPSPPQGKKRWGGYGKDPVSVYIEENIR